MRQLPNLIKSSVLLLFIDIVLVLDHLKNPYFVLFGIFFMEHLWATVMVLLLVFIGIVAGYGILRKRRFAYRLGLALAAFLFINSLINLVLLAFVAGDISDFLHQRIFGENVFLGFVFLQLMFLAVNAFLFINIKASRKLLK